LSEKRPFLMWALLFWPNPIILLTCFGSIAHQSLLLKKSRGNAMVKISEVRPGVGNVTIEGEIVAKEEPRDVVSKFGKRLRVCSATIQDDSGSMTLSLWNDDIEKVNVGDKVQIENGWVTEFKQQPQISAGKNGKITIMGK